MIGGRAAAAQVWTWDLASRMVEGILLLKKQLRRTYKYYAYPSIGTEVSEGDTKEPARFKWKCNACRNI